MSRREQLQAMLADSPDDIFLQYALAIEWQNEDEHDKSLDIHQTLMNGNPPYVPSFFMAGQQLTDLDRIDEAKEILEAGIEQADAQGNLHAAGEMRGFLATL
ncbi:MAG: hypothetical protein AAFN77_00315 [Planctomycetota bacterium]